MVAAQLIRLSIILVRLFAIFSKETTADTQGKSTSASAEERTPAQRTTANKESDEEEEREREAERERELQRQREIERELERQREIERELERQREIERELERQREIERELERQREIERELERQREIERELERQREIERELERQREIERELERQREIERELERQREIERELERQREIERELERQREIERELQTQREIEWELERQRETDWELERRGELERELERQRQTERELQSQRAGAPNRARARKRRGRETDRAMAAGRERLDPWPQRLMAVCSVFTLVQGGLQLAGASMGLSLWTCSLHIYSSFHWQMVRFYYFANWNCRQSYPLNNTVYFLNGQNNASYRTMVIMSIYTALSSIWIIGSFLVLASSIKGKHIRPDVGRRMHYPWVAAMVLILILDAIASVLFCVDLLSTKDFTSLMGLLNIKPDGGIQELGERSVPPTIMALLTSKGIVIWIINIVVLIVLAKQFKKILAIRQQAQFVRAHMTAIPPYLTPSIHKNESSNSDKTPEEPFTIPPLPRLVHEGGRVRGTSSQAGTAAARQSALRIAARQGFNYEVPKSTLWTPTVLEAQQRPPRVSSPQRYESVLFRQPTPDNWQLQDNLRDSDDRASNLLQRDNDVFY